VNALLRSLVLRSPRSVERWNRAAVRREVLANGPRVARLRENFAQVLGDPPERVERHVEEFLLNSRRDGPAVLRYEAMSGAQLRAYCKSEIATVGREHFDAAAASPRPIVLFTPHFGNYALAAVWLALELEGRKQVLYFYDPPERNPFATRLRGLLEKVGAGAEGIHNDRGAVLKALKGLRRGALLTMMPDIYHFERATTFVPMFGRFAYMMPGTAFFALKADAVLLPLHCHYDPSGATEFRFDAPLEPARTGDADEDIYRTSAAIAATMETHIRENPGLWAYCESLPARFAGLTRPVGGEAWESGWRFLEARHVAAYPETAPGFAAFDRARAEKSA
jgi:KDO2-lipid IV(A) lauroyltransferase